VTASDQKSNRNDIAQPITEEPKALDEESEQNSTRKKDLFEMMDKDGDGTISR